MMKSILIKDVRIARHAGLAVDLLGTYIRIISTESARSRRLMKNIWKGIEKEEISYKRN